MAKSAFAAGQLRSLIERVERLEGPALLWSGVDVVKLIELWRDEDGVDLPLRNSAGAVPGWQIRRNLARARA
jgi:hypothetical protein